MKRIILALGALATAIASTVMLTSNTAAAVRCVQYPGHDAYTCVTAQSGNGALYWSDYLFTREFYWHPATGYLTATEIYFCGKGDQSPGNGHVACEKPAPGVTGKAEWQRRVITLANGCVIDGWPVADTVSHPAAPQFCTSAVTGETTPTTALEKASVLRFWRILSSVPGKW